MHSAFPGMDMTHDPNEPEGRPHLLRVGDVEPSAAAPELLASAETRWGSVVYPVEDDPIGRSLAQYGEWAGIEIDLLLRFVPEGSTVLDVGANLGTHTLAFAKKAGPAGTVVAVEPQRTAVQLLAQTMRANQLDSVRVLHACAGERDGFAWVPSVDLAEHQNLGAVIPESRDDDATSNVRVVALDALDVTNVALLKIDVEGAEALVLAGATRIIERDHPVISFEANTLESAADAFRWVRARGYRTWLHRAPAWNPNNHAGNVENTFGFATETNVLAIPEGRVPVDLDSEGLVECPTLDALAKWLMESPRYGDPTAYHRSVEATRDVLHATLRELDDVRADSSRLAARARSLESETRSLEQRVDELTRERARLEAELHSADERIRSESARAIRSNASAQSERSRSAQLAIELARPTHRVARALDTSLQVTTRAASEGLGKTATRIKKTFARRRRHEREVRVILESGLFDFEFYAEQGGDATDPVRDYVARGAREGLDPTPYFDTSYYFETSPDVSASAMNPFVHYLEFGAREGRNPNAFFDGRGYLKQLEATSLASTNPIAHYVRIGASTGFRAGPYFDADFYQAEYSDVREAGIEPLLHFLRYGIHEGRKPSPSGSRARVVYAKAGRPTEPTEAEWDAVRPHSASSATVDVIIPVYRGRADTLRAIHRVLESANERPYELVVIDDASPEHDLSETLRELGSRGLFTYLRNETNLGFVGTVNRGMALHPARDVLLLNSDTEVYGNWLDRMTATARSDRRFGTITPFSNSATVCSYPTFPEDNDMALELPFETLDRLFADANRAETVELPTAVGFCMYITRECLDATGPFDEARFGKGYGEENDFCRRALRHGFVNVMACDVFVRHTGGASFQGEKAARVSRAMEILDEIYPDYQGEVRAFLSRDPIRPFRERVDLARVRRALGERAIAFVSHRVGGGTEQHVQDLAAMARAEGVGVLVLRPSVSSPSEVEVTFGIDAPLPNLRPLRVQDPEGTARFLEAVGVTHLHVHHLLGFAPAARSWITALAKRDSLRVDFTVHDYAPICPRINLMDATERYCGEPVVSTCERCVSKLGSPFGHVPVAEFRKEHETMLRAVRHVYVPNADVGERLAKHVRDLPTIVMPHPEPTIGRRVAARHEPGERLRVIALGGIGVHKGFEVLVRCAEDAGARALPLEFVVVGHTCDTPRATRAGIRVTGAYEDNAEATEVIERIGGHVAFFPAVWPETYSYTLSLALSAGLYPVSFAFGAIAERLRTLDVGLLLPLDTMTDPARINDALVALAKAPIEDVPVPALRRYTLATYYGSDE